MRRKLFAAFLALCAFAPAALVEDFNSREWRDEMSKGFYPYQKLSMDDFPVNDDKPSTHQMYTLGFVHYNYKARWSSRGGSATANVTEITVRSGFDKNGSWRRSTVGKNASLLAHEQVHLDINELYATEFRHANLPSGIGVDGASAMEDLRQKVKVAVERMIKTAQAEQDRYDNETNHGKNKEVQQLWIDATRRKLNDQRITYWDKAG